MARTIRSTLSILPLLVAPAAVLAQSSAPSAPSAVPASPSDAELSIEPRNGQSRQQQWDDRYACHDWAKNQSGFDPSRLNGGVPADETAPKRRQYQRAMIACLEGRGYTVRVTAPPTAPPAALPLSQPRFVARRSSAVPVNEFRYHPLTVQISGGYSVTTGSIKDTLNNGWNAGLGFTWQPVAALPLSFVVDGSYSRFGESDQSLALASQSTGSHITFGHLSLYGGDTDARIDLSMGPSVREYFFGGVGWYREQTVFGQDAFQPGLICFYSCIPGFVRSGSTVERSTTGWLNSWNAGMGFEFALANPASFFIEARYVRLSPVSSRTGFVPIRFGIRF